MEKNNQSNNFIKDMYPLTKMYIALLLSAAGLLFSSMLTKLLVFILVNILAYLSGEYKTFLKRIIASVGVLFALLLVIQTLFHPGEIVIFSFWIFSGTKEGLLFAINLGLNILCVGGSLIWFFTVTKEKDFILSLEKKGMSAQASYVILSTLQMVPILKERSNVIMDAQRARGVETEGNLITRAKVFVPTIVPLVLSSISGIEERALTLEARGFSVKTPATHLYDIEETKRDRVINKIIFILFIILIIGRVALWII